MQRILIVGRSGTGKSTLARKIGVRLRLPVIHLDRYYFHPGWQPIEAETFAATVAELAGGDRWVIEGNYSSHMAPRIARADTVLVLDRPRILCLLSVLRRALRSYGRVREDSAPGCPERFDPSFMKFVWRWRGDRINRALQPFTGERIDLRSRRAIGRFVRRLDQRAGDART